MRVVLIISALAAVILPGVVHGLWSGRWNLSDEPGASVSRLEHLPLFMPNWEGNDLRLNPRELERAELAGYLNRRYVHRKDGSHAFILLACGRSGPVTVHTPEFCYTGLGYRMMHSPERKKIDGGKEFPEAEFFTASFEKTSSAGETNRIQIYWSWKGTGGWQAPAYPRWVFGGQPVLHKLYVIQPLTGPNQLSEKTCLEFIRAFLPEVQKNLFSR